MTASSRSRPTSGAVGAAGASRVLSIPPSETACTASGRPFSFSGSTASAANCVLRRVQELRWNEDLARGRLGHQAGGERRRPAEDRVRAAEGRADLAREHAATADADREWQLRVGVDRGSDRAQHPLHVVLRHARRAGDQDDPRSVAIDVALEEADLVLGRGVLHRLHHLCDGRRRGRRPLALHERVGPREADERDGRLPMLGLGDIRREVRADQARDAVHERQVVDGRKRPVLVLRGGCRREQEAVVACVAQHVGRQQPRGGAAHRDLSRLRRRLHAHGGRRGGPSDDELSMVAAREHEEEFAGVDPDVHLQRHGARRRAGTPDRPERSPHLVGGPRGAGGVTLAVVSNT